ncbi:MAG TPA: LysR family transcriptional regulator [Clostridiaceae bacterium]|nr:LysR family transcriptional regulator [Clostridiaceae bacterium]
MNFSQLEAFVNVVRLKSFSAAAKAMYLSQPTISLKVKELERIIGAPLVVRSTRAVTLTALGEALFPFAKKIIDLKSRMEQEAVRQQEGVFGSLVIAVSSTPAQHLLPPVLVRVAKAHPQSCFEVLRSDSSQVMDDVSSGVAELGVSGREVKAAGLESFPLINDRLMVIAPTGDVYRHLHAPLTADLFRKLPFIGREAGSGTRAWTLSYLSRLGIAESDLRQIATLPGNEHVVAAVKAGLGISIVSALAVSEDIKRGDVRGFELEDNIPARAFHLIKSRKRVMSPLAAVVAEALTEFCKTLKI